MKELNKEDVMHPVVIMFGAKICSIRTVLGLNQGELAKKVGLTRVSVNNIEHGRHSNITLKHVELFARALGTTPKNLMKGIWF